MDDLEKEGYYISPGISLNEALKKKRKKEEDNVHENKPKKISKPQAMIQELSVIPISNEPSITAPSEDSNMEKSKSPQMSYTEFNSEVREHLLKNLNNAMVRKRTDTARKIYDVFSKLGENKIQQVKSFTASNFSDLTRTMIQELSVIPISNEPSITAPSEDSNMEKSKSPQMSYTEFNSEVREHLLKNLNNAMVRKRTDTARKIYDVFSKLGENKIQQVKSFTASNFSDLTRSEVKCIIENFPSND
ncbi:591_t:CDS:2 [Entrophospora sp. SA101]|nr:591_t:CDS:2 [Entrophospora sp. SA101]